jgi:hypothetical protein
MEILITDLTEMNSGQYCVAGWDIAARRMVRPLPDGGNWPAALVTQHGIISGKVIRVEPRGAANGIFPHRTEDTPVDLASIQSANGVFSDWLGATAPQVAANLNTGFGNQLRWNSVWDGVKRGVHILPRTQCGSLVAVRIPKDRLLFSEAFGKLKASLNDGSDSYQLTVSSKAIKEAWRAGGLAALGAALPARGEVHVRVGLARPYDDPPKCYAMLNGVL